MKVLLLFYAIVGAQDSPGPHKTVVIVATVNSVNWIADEQSLHPDTSDVYVGGLYDIVPRQITALGGRSDRWSRSIRSIRAVMTRPVRPGTRLLMIIDRAHERPVAVWWDQASKHTCIPGKTFARYDLQSVTVRFSKRQDGSFCVRL